MWNGSLNTDSLSPFFGGFQLNSAPFWSGLGAGSTYDDKKDSFKIGDAFGSFGSALRQLDNADSGYDVASAFLDVIGSLLGSII